MDAVVLKRGRERPLKERHHWIFSGAIDFYPEGYLNGELVPIKSSEGEILGWGFFKKENSLAGRVVSFGKEEVYLSLKNTLQQALLVRKSLLQDPSTTACRLINGEGDYLPGLIVDKYGPYLVIQTGALGMRKLLPFFIEQLCQLLPIEGIYDKSIGSGLKSEGIEPQEKVLFGEIPESVQIKENGMRFNVQIKKGQKTGFFLDQREMRKQISELCKNKRVLNAFCYTGGFTVAALQGGATHVDSVDISETATQLCRENVLLNDYPESSARFFSEDVFAFLAARSLDYDLVILDPPAFAKKKQDIPNAAKAYKKLFKLAIHKMPKGSFALLSSCSYYINEIIFESIVKSAVLESQKKGRIIGKHRLAIDHPINLHHSESSYLKSLLIEI